MSKDLHAEITKLNMRIEELEFTISELRGGRSVAGLQERFGLTPSEARVLAFLADGRLHTKGSIMVAIGRDEYDSTSIISVWILRIRKKSGLHIITHWDAGYRLDNDGAKLVRDILSGATNAS